MFYALLSALKSLNHTHIALRAQCSDTLKIPAPRVCVCVYIYIYLYLYIYVYLQRESMSIYLSPAHLAASTAFTRAWCSWKMSPLHQSHKLGFTAEVLKRTQQYNCAGYSEGLTPIRQQKEAASIKKHCVSSSLQCSSLTKETGKHAPVKWPNLP